MVTSIARKAVRGGGALLASLALVAALLPASALAQPNATQDGPLEAQAGLLASGTSGTCTWEIDENGKLTIRPENGISGTLEGTTGRAVWYDYSDAIKEAHVANGVKTDLFANGLFSYLINLETIDLGGLDTSETADMGGMFHGCISLKSIDLSSFDTSNAGRMINMFANCSSLESLDLRSFDTSDVGYMNGMFSGCSSLKELNLSSFDMSSIANFNSVFDESGTVDMFKGCNSLQKVVLGAKYKFENTKESELPEGNWLSQATGRTLTSSQIAELRNNIADTYTKVTMPDPGTTDPGTTDPGTTDPKPDDGDEPGTTDPVSTQAMYRLYNPNSGEHFYTASTIERDSVIAAGWNDEGIGWTAPTQGIQVYRLYNSFAGEHHYTTSAEERDMLVGVGWTWEEGGWFSDVDESVPLYRAYNPNAFANNHHYTTDRGEFETLLSLGWQDEGVGWYGVN